MEWPPAGPFAAGFEDPATYVWVLDADGVVVRTDDRAAALAGGDDPVGDRLSAAAYRTDPERVRAPVERVLEGAFAAAIAEASVGDAVSTERAGAAVRDGTVILDLSVRPVGADGAVEGVVVDEPDRVPLRAVARDAWAEVDAPDASLKVRADDADVRADPPRLRRLFENLLANAVDHGGADVSVRVGAIDGGGFYVADDGAGVPGDARDPGFERGHTTADDGTGFGLAIVRSIAEAHGWSVGLGESHAGGARFEFTDV